jgi:CheY-like chemotaxis protein
MNTPKESVLIVEDDADLREALTDTLQAAGIPAAAAGSAGEALKLLESPSRRQSPPCAKARPTTS